ncbi:MAG: GPP34 family phosphoprotein [Chromatiaceae bacterium]|nr:GPP34 family phosphoprotein [Chromatiaceae bacterium]
MLTFAEEFLLLAHDEESGDFAEIGFQVMSSVLAGAALMDLALQGRIDSDQHHLILVDPKPVDEPILDFCLARIAETREPKSIQDWITALAIHGARLRSLTIDRLLARGILERANKRFLWVFHTRVYPLIDERETVEVKRRIADILFTDDIPDPRDTFLLALAERSGLLTEVFSQAVAEDRRERIQQLLHLDLLGQAVNKAIRHIQLAMLSGGPSEV